MKHRQNFPAAAAVLLLCLLSGACVTAIPRPEYRQGVTPEVADLYERSGAAYEREAEEHLAAAREARTLLEVNRGLGDAWDAYGNAWDRYALAGGVDGLAHVALATVSADTGDIKDGIADGLTLFSSMMERFQRADKMVLADPGFAKLEEDLHEIALHPADSFDRVRRQWAIELALLGIDGGVRESPHYEHLTRILDRAELAPELRGKIPFKWSKEAATSLQKALAPR